MKKVLLQALGIVTLVFFFASNVAASDGGTKKPTITDSLKITTDMEYDDETRNLKVNFSNVMLLKELQYRVKYTVEDKVQTIYGEITPYTNNDIERNLRLGECSGNACTYDGTVKDIQIDYVAEYFFLGHEKMTIEL